MPPYTFGQTAKTWTATVGVGATALIGVLAGDTTVGRVLTIVSAVGTAAAVYAVPNAPTHDAPEMQSVYDPPPPADPVPSEQPEG